MAGLFIVVIIFAFIADAHDYWLVSNKFFYSIREIAVVRLKKGVHFIAENQKTDSSPKGQFFYYKPSGEPNNLHLLLQDNADSVLLPLKEEGTHMIVFSSLNTTISVEPEKFKRFLVDEGLDKAFLSASVNNELQSGAIEQYQLCSKTIFQVGSQAKPGITCTTPTDLSLDIIPSENPYALPDPGLSAGPIKVRFRVLFKKEPVQNALVRVWYLEKGKGVQADSLRTNNRGYITTLRHPGPNLLTCVYIEKIPVGWQSYRGSLSFEYSQFFPRNAGS